jgi:hypothetical protein
MSQKYCVEIKKSKIHGGRRCIEPNCKEHAIGKTYKCVAHSSGVARCIKPDCKDRVIGKTDYCSLHFLFN